MIPPRELDAVFGDSEPPEEVESLRPRSFASTVGVWRVRRASRTAVLKLIRLGAAATPRWPSVALLGRWREVARGLPSEP